MDIKVIDERSVLGKDFKVYGTTENPLFLAKDVAEWIDYSYKDSRKTARDTSKMLKTIDEEEKLVGTLFLSGQNREAWFLTEDGLYEVLMQSRKPIAKQFKKKVKKLLKDLRLNRFNPYENMSKELQAILLVDKKQQELDNRITTIEDKMTVNYELAENLRSAINCRAVELLGGKDAEAYKKLNKKLYASFYRDIKRTFKVNSYKNLSVKNYDLAISFIEAWEPKDEVLKYAIHGLNSQIAFA